jgi:hypothetical protein
MAGLPTNAPAVANNTLELISLDAEAEGRGLITVIVVNDDGQPGPGWLELARSVGRGANDHHALIASEREFVFAHARDEVPSSIY